MSDSPQLPPSEPAVQRLPVVSKTTNTIVPLDPREPVITTTQETRGFPDVLPTLIPALQSSSYVLIILLAFAAWSSRNLARTFFNRHLDLMVTMKTSLETQTIANDKHVDILSQLTENNRMMAHALEVSAQARSMREEDERK